MNDEQREWLENYIVESRDSQYREWLKHQDNEKIFWLLAELAKDQQYASEIVALEQVRAEASKRGIPLS